MKRWKKYASLLLALVLCLCMAACGGEDSTEEDYYEEEVSDDGEISIEDLEGYWSPVEGIGSTTSVLISIYIDAASETWEEYDQYGEPTGYSGDAYTDGIVLTFTDVPLIGDVEAPIGDADTLVTDTGEIYWAKGYPDYDEKPDLSSDYYGRWYLRGDHDSEYATVLTLNEDGTYTRSDTEEGTFTYSEYDQEVSAEGTDTTVFRQEIALSISMGEMYYLVSDGQVLVHWADDGDNYYIHEDALENVQLLREYQMTDGDSYWGEDYTLAFFRDHTLSCNPFDGTEARLGMWELSDDTIMIFWDDGETDEATLDPENPDSLTLHSTGETLAKLF